MFVGRRRRSGQGTRLLPLQVVPYLTSPTEPRPGAVRDARLR